MTKLEGASYGPHNEGKPGHMVILLHGYSDSRQSFELALSSSSALAGVRSSSTRRPFESLVATCTP